MKTWFLPRELPSRGAREDGRNAVVLAATPHCAKTSTIRVPRASDRFGFYLPSPSDRRAANRPSHRVQWVGSDPIAAAGCRYAGPLNRGRKRPSEAVVFTHKLIGGGVAALAAFSFATIPARADRGPSALDWTIGAEMAASQSSPGPASDGYWSHELVRTPSWALRAWRQAAAPLREEPRAVRPSIALSGLGEFNRRVAKVSNGRAVVDRSRRWLRTAAFPGGGR